MEFLQDDLRVFVVPVDIFEVPDLTMAEQMVYIVLRSYCNPHEPVAFPSYETIAQKARMSRRNAIRIVQSLTEKGLLSKETRGKYDPKEKTFRHTSNLYTVKTPKKPKKSSDTTSLGSDNMSPIASDNMSPGSDTTSPEHNYLTKPIRTKQKKNNYIPRSSKLSKPKTTDLPEWVIKQQLDAGHREVAVSTEEVDEVKQREVNELLRALGELD